MAATNEIANIVTAVATTLGSVVAMIGAWISYRNLRATQEDSLPDIGFGKMRYCNIFDQTALEVEIVYRNQSHRDLHIHSVFFQKPKNVAVGHSREYRNGGYYPTNFKPGSISEARVIASAGEIENFMSRSRKADRTDPEYYLIIPPDSSLIECQVTYSFGAGHGKRRKYKFQTTIKADPEGAERLYSTVDRANKTITVSANKDNASLTDQ